MVHFIELSAGVAPSSISVIIINPFLPLCLSETNTSFRYFLILFIYVNYKGLFTYLNFQVELDGAFRWGSSFIYFCDSDQALVSPLRLHSENITHFKTLGG